MSTAVPTVAHKYGTRRISRWLAPVRISSKTMQPMAPVKNLDVLALATKKKTKMKMRIKWDSR